MYRKTKINTLMLLFFILLIIIGAYKLFDYYKGENKIKNKFIKTDTAAITIIRFFPRSTQYKEVIFYRNGEDWSIKFNRNAWLADQVLVKSILAEIADMKIDHVATTEQSKWSEFGVAENEGVRVKLEENNIIDVHFIVGKMSFSQSPDAARNNDAQTYIRISNQDKVYAVTGRLADLFDRSFNSFRNGTIANVGKENITRLTFIYNGDSSYVLTKKGNDWMIADRKMEISKVSDYLNFISHLQSSDFAEDYDKSKLTKPESIIRIEGNNFNSFSVTAFRADPPMKYAIVSTSNPSGIFRGDINDLYKKIFIGKKQLLHSVSAR